MALHRFRRRANLVRCVVTRCECLVCMEPAGVRRLLPELAMLIELPPKPRLPRPMIHWMPPHVWADMLRRVDPFTVPPYAPDYYEVLD